MIAIQTNAAKLDRMIAQYAHLSGQGLDFALAKAAGNFSYYLNRNWHALMPAKGSIRAQAARILQGGGGIRVRESIQKRVASGKGVHEVAPGVYRFNKKKTGTKKSGGKRLNFRALAVRAEINAREAGRGFLQYSAIFPTEGTGKSKVFKWGSRVRSGRKGGDVLSESTVKLGTDGRMVRLLWPGVSRLGLDILGGINKPKAMAGINSAFLKAMENMKPYLLRKQKEMARKAGFIGA